MNLEILGAREHNLKNIDITLPHGKLIVFTGLSGSGKSTLAFDTIYAEGQRRYMETFSAYARHFIGNMERPDVDRINGLSPVISIEQKTTNKNPRSTVGTVTEIYDLVRLLYARVGEAYSHVSGAKMVRYSDHQILDLILQDFDNCDITVLAPVVKGRKGHYRELFEQIAKKGFVRVRVDNEIRELTYKMQVDRYKTHDIEIVVDRIRVSPSSEKRLQDAAKTAFSHGKGVLMVLDNASGKVRYFSRMLMDPVTGISYPEPEPNTFSFNSPYGACPKCNGLGEITEIDLSKLIPDSSKSIRDGAFDCLGRFSATNPIFIQLEHLGKDFGFDLDTPISQFTEEAMNMVLYGTSDYSPLLEGDDAAAPYGFEGIVNYIRQFASDESSAALQKWAASFMDPVPCPQCHGLRLRPESLHFLIDGKNIGEAAQMDLEEFYQWISQLEPRLAPSQQEIAHEILREILTRTRFLLDVGVGYLSLARSSRTLSGGESQRIRLATQIGAQLTGVLYILDEPSIGLHQRDNCRLINALKKLRDIGNTVIVVEHDRDMMLSADHLVDIGPGAGLHGGRIMYEGPVEPILKKPGFNPHKSLTLEYLHRKLDMPVPPRRSAQGHPTLSLIGASGNNLKDLSVSIPLELFVCVTGVSGSGKSTLINGTLTPILQRHFYHSQSRPLPYKECIGLEHIDKVIQIDQSPIGRTPRSNPATYVGIFDDIRQLFAQMPSARIRGYKSGRFSFNVSGGRCEACKGAGVRTIEMNFLPDVYVNCETCGGKRYNRETLEIRYRGKSISDILDLTVEQAVEFFAAQPKILRRLQAIQQVGLGYITLGQPSTTLSGGEAQRIKLAAELSRPSTGHTLYLLDEPTTGLHFDDIRQLLSVLQALVDKGNSVLVIEHNLDVIKSADYIIDLGPEGGRGGGTLVCCGTPEEVAANPGSLTGQFLKEELANTKSI